jgi:hypothetical protein
MSGLGTAAGVGADVAGGPVGASEDGTMGAGDPPDEDARATGPTTGWRDLATANPAAPATARTTATAATLAVQRGPARCSPGSLTRFIVG